MKGEHLRMFRETMCLDFDLAAKYLGLEPDDLRALEADGAEVSEGASSFIVHSYEMVIKGALRRSAGAPPRGVPRLVVDNTGNGGGQ